MNNEVNFPPNFERLVLGCIDADFASQYALELNIRDGNLLSRFTLSTYFCSVLNSKLRTFCNIYF